jgi:hypothetical protein
LARVWVSSERRHVRLKLTEKASEVLEVKKLKLWDAKGQEVETDIPLVNDTLHSQVREIPDGGTWLVPVHFRPPSAKANKRWWVLSVTPRIIIEAEEQLERNDFMESVLPELLADVLKNPRLKSTTDFYGTPGDTRFALVDSEVWTWPEKLQPAIAGRQLVPVSSEGKRLLGIRVDQYQPAENEKPHLITVILVNAGGTTNGEVFGGCTLRYTARRGENGWVVELSEPLKQ